MACVETHTAFLMDRGGERRLAEIGDLSEVMWSRKFSQRSTARVKILGKDCERQAKVIEQVEPRRHEMAIYRGNERVWEGPIYDASFGRENVMIQAADVVEYLNGTPLSKAWLAPEDEDESVLMGERIEEIISYELTEPYTMPTSAGDRTIQRWEALDPAVNVLPFLDVRPGAVRSRTETMPFQMTVGEHLDALASSGLAYTVVGRQLIIWDAALSIGSTRQLTQDDFDGDPRIYASGSDLVIVQHVVSNANNDPFDLENIGTATIDESYYGPWTNVHTRADEIGGDEELQVALNTQASRLGLGRYPTPTDIITPQGSALRIDGSLPISVLVPGVSVPVLARLSGRDLNRVQMLSSLTVTENSQGETVSADISSGVSENGE